MNRISYIIASLTLCVCTGQVLVAQELTDAQKAAAAAAKAIAEAPEVKK